MSIAWWFLKGKYADYRTRRDAWNLGYTAWESIDNTWAQAIGAGRDYVYTKRIWHVWGCNLPIYPSRPKFLEPDVEALFYLPPCPGGGYYNPNGYYQTITVHVPVARKNDGLISPNLAVWKKGQNPNDRVTNFYYGDEGADGGYNHSELRRARRAYTLPGVFQAGEVTPQWNQVKTGWGINMIVTNPTIVTVLITFLFMTVTDCSKSLPIDNDDNQPQESLRLLWQYNGNIDAPVMPYTVHDTLVVFATKNGINGININTGEIAWTTNYGSDNSLVCENLIIGRSSVFGILPHQLSEWDLLTGKPVWKYELPDSVRTVSHSRSVSTDQNIFLAVDDMVLDIDRFQGITTRYPIKGYPYTVHYNNGRITIGSIWAEQKENGTYEHGSIIVDDILSGNTLWTFTPTGTAPSYTAPLILDENRVYFGTNSGGGKTTDIFRFYALNVDDGSLIWKTNEEIFTYYAIVVGNTIYGNDGLGLYALDKHSGQVIWQTELNAGHGEYELVHLNGYLYHPHGVGMRVVNAITGEVVQVVQPPDQSYFWHVTVGKNRIVAQSNYHLYCYEPYQPE